MMSKKEQHAQAVKIATAAMQALAKEVGPEAFIEAFEATVNLEADPTTSVGRAWYYLNDQVQQAEFEVDFG